MMRVHRAAEVSTAFPLTEGNAAIWRLFGRSRWDSISLRGTNANA